MLANLIRVLCPFCRLREMIGISHTGAHQFLDNRYYDGGFECWIRQCTFCYSMWEDGEQSGEPEHSYAGSEWWHESLEDIEYSEVQLHD